MKIRLASVVPCTEAEGPGVRFAIWVRGCSIRCPGCVNPNMFAADGPETWVHEVIDQIIETQTKRPELEGVSFLGGEPFEQDQALAIVGAVARDRGLSVMTYTGYEYNDPRVQGSPLLDVTDLLKTGPYVESLRTTKRRWIGSTNQRFYFMPGGRYWPGDARFSEPNHAEIQFVNGEITVVGFPFESVTKAFPQRLNAIR